jgi:hypothetical protein
MKTRRRSNVHDTTSSTSPVLVAALLAALLVGSASSAEVPADKRGSCRPCNSVAMLALQAAIAEATSDYWLATANAANLPDAAQRRAALRQARADLRESTGEAREQYAARVELCEALGESRCHPVIDPDDFLTPEEAAAAPNPYMPLVPGTTYRYEGETEDGPEVVVVEVTDETREILGVTCVVVRDTVWVDDELVEDTRDWFAQDSEGNVWYFGELSVEYEDGEIAALEGSWEAGTDSAKPGIVMKASPEVDDVYRQEFLLGEAEDAAEVLSLSESVSVSAGTFDNCLMTGEFTPLEPDVYENKYYAPGVGMVLEVNTETGERVELVSVETD